jgi:hypothetical protein
MFILVQIIFGLTNYRYAFTTTKDSLKARRINSMMMPLVFFRWISNSMFMLF